MKIMVRRGWRTLCACGLTLIWVGGATAEEPAKKPAFPQIMATAQAELAAGHWETARLNFVRALAHQPADADARYGLGCAYRALARYHEARRHFRLALAARPADSRWQGQCRMQIAGCWEDTGEYREALLERQLALQADPKLAGDRDRRATRADARAPQAAAATKNAQNAGDGIQ